MEETSARLLAAEVKRLDIPLADAKLLERPCPSCGKASEPLLTNLYWRRCKDGHRWQRHELGTEWYQCIGENDCPFCIYYAIKRGEVTRPSNEFQSAVLALKQRQDAERERRRQQFEREQRRMRRAIVPVIREALTMGMPRLETIQAIESYYCNCPECGERCIQRDIVPDTTIAQHCSCNYRWLIHATTLNDETGVPYVFPCPETPDCPFCEFFEQNPTFKYRV